MTDAQKRAKIIRYLSDVYVRNPEAEVSSHELAHELEMPMDEVRRNVKYLVASGFATAEVFPVNVWVRITDQGLRLAESR